MIEVSSISCRRGENLCFEDVSLKASSGDAVIITGQNGAGKTTLLCAIAGLYPTEQGRITWHGAPIKEKIQDFHKSVMMIGHKKALKGRETTSDHMLRWAKLYRVAPDGIESILESWEIDPESQIRTLSAGQQQRLALAKLNLSPKILWLLDEPHASLDTRGKEILLENTAKHRESGGIVIASTHDPIAWNNVSLLEIDHKFAQELAA